MFTYQVWQTNHNYPRFIVLLIISIIVTSFHRLSKWRCYKVKSELPCFVLSLFLMTYHINNANAISATSANVIHGHAPYLTFNGGVTEGDIRTLLGIRLSDGREYVPEGGESSLYPNAIVVSRYSSTKINLGVGVDSLNVIHPLVPRPDNSIFSNIKLQDYIGANNYWIDEDGDDNVDITGQLEITWTDGNYNDITDIIKRNPAYKLEACSGPYELRLKITKSQLSTLYGEPRSKTLNNHENIHNYSFFPDTAINGARVCHAYPPKMEHFSGHNLIPDKGFLVKNINNPEENFPTTGSNNLDFYLLLAGITPEQVINANGTIVSAVSGGNSVKLLLSSANKPDEVGEARAVLRIKLKGPNINSNDKNFSPSLFKLYADSRHTQLLYSFKIERWYITKPYSYDSNDNYPEVNYAQAQQFCRDLGSNYRIPSIGDYTNANSDDGFWHWGEPGQENNIIPHISYKIGNRWVGGFLNEWNAGYNGGSAGWISSEYWASESYAGKQYVVDSVTGSIFNSSYDSMPACVTP